MHRGTIKSSLAVAKTASLPEISLIRGNGGRARMAQVKELIRMAAFESWDEYRHFANSVKCNFRHVLEPRSQRFLDVLIETSAKREVFPRKSDALWRAQLGHGWRVEIIDD